MACVLPSGPALLPARTSVLDGAVLQVSTAAISAHDHKIPKARNTGIGDLPEELIIDIVNEKIAVRELCVLAQVSHKFRQLSVTHALRG